MSIDVMVSVWKHSKQKAAARLLLIAIADSANDHGEAWPGIKALAKKCNTSDRNIQKLIKHLEESGELRVVESGGQSTVNGATNKYIVITPDVPLPTSIKEARPVNAGTPVPNSTPVKKHAKGGVPQYTGPVSPSTPNPKVNPKEPAAYARARETPQEPPPPPDVSIQDQLVSIGLNLNQARLALAARPITQAEVDRIRLWLQTCTAHKPMGVLWMRLKAGLLPDDLPKPPEPPPAPLPDIQYDKLPDGRLRPKTAADAARILGSSISAPGGLRP